MARHFRNQLVEEKFGKTATERVIFIDAVIAILDGIGRDGEYAGIYEDADHWRQIMFRDQVIEDHWYAHAVAERSAAVKEDHERRGLACVILRWDVDGAVMWRAGVVLSGAQNEAGDCALRHAFVWL